MFPPDDVADTVFEAQQFEPASSEPDEMSGFGINGE